MQEIDLLVVDKKQCAHCLKIKPLAEFNKNKSRRDGYQHLCKTCARQSRLKYEAQHPESVKEARRKYSSSKKGIKTTKLYANSGRGKLLRKERDQRRRSRNPEKNRARTMVNWAISQGKIPPANTLICFECGIRQADQYHHRNGYSKEHYLDVIPVCLSCHKAVHLKPVRSSR